ncbi:nucleotidyltransferase family protein [Massilia sp. R2A-15]|uniref:nucleotidyltransferase domain-containing protein n=1 Tax=Massilia sp. R2A-15 TaxID=3064278 RepID=UPI002736F1D1|nr:nucleotidyltransferase family protein [Massilia sp. R2A-15]WLI88894.1 nucleotidyltransferase family protein [Massilia sp. R2A-15]
MKPLPLIVQAFRDPPRIAAFSLAEWDLLLRQAAVANLGAALFYLAEQEGVLAAVPAQARAHLDWSRVRGERHRQAVRFEVREIRRALAGLGLPLILMKGAAYAAAARAPAPGRLFSDIDIMVPKERLGDVEAALMLHGWASGHTDAYDQRYYREWMHELPPMQHIKRQSLIDVHHAILPETAADRPDPHKLRAATVAVGDDEGLRVFAPADMVLHSAVHLFYDGEFGKGLRDLIDIHRLLLEFGREPGFWAALPRRAAELELARPLFYALRYSARLLGTPVPDEVMAGQAGRPPAPLLALMDALFLRALLPMHASCTGRLSGTARFLLYLRGNWLRMPPLLLARHLFHKAFISPRTQQDA